MWQNVMPHNAMWHSSFHMEQNSLMDVGSILLPICIIIYIHHVLCIVIISFKQGYINRYFLYY